MHLLRTLTISTLTLASLGAQAFELTDELSFNVTPAIVSDYRASGLSQTQGNPAAQLNLILQHASGLYAGVWTSNVDFGYDSKTRQEIEYYAGYYWQMTDDISLDTWLTKYEFPREGQYNQSDIQSTLDVYGVLLGGKYASDVKGPDYYDENGLEVFNDTHEEEDFSSWFVGYQTHLPMDIGLRATYETVDYKDDVFYTSNGSSRCRLQQLGSQTEQRALASRLEPELHRYRPVGQRMRKLHGLSRCLLGNRGGRRQHHLLTIPGPVAAWVKPCANLNRLRWFLKPDLPR